MEPLLGVLGASAIAAIAGTAVKGMLRPLSWAMLIASALLFGSSKIVDATNALSQNPRPDPNPTSTLSSNSAISSPPVAQGWQSIAQSLDPSLSTLYGQGQLVQGQPNPTQFNQDSLNPDPVSQGQPQGTGQPAIPPEPTLTGNSTGTTAAVPPVAPPTRVSTTRPIVGLW
ncbi:MAG: hypothetical protein HY785_24240 [Oscillatoriophycideae cyanobacterium NC_groundwater_1537_Pr4_S-0.65um_50_18]|nr:hypothetical protein [Oscillatoriophycideae cyanobacterium NC_groundwater_1537_Pr4_S-0.65um_50_18]